MTGQIGLSDLERENALLLAIIEATSAGPGVEPLAGAVARLIASATATDVCFVHVLDDAGTSLSLAGATPPFDETDAVNVTVSPTWLGFSEDTTLVVVATCACAANAGSRNAQARSAAVAIDRQFGPFALRRGRFGSEEIPIARTKNAMRDAARPSDVI